MIINSVPRYKNRTKRILLVCVDNNLDLELGSYFSSQSYIAKLSAIGCVESSKNLRNIIFTFKPHIIIIDFDRVKFDTHELGRAIANRIIRRDKPSIKGLYTKNPTIVAIFSDGYKEDTKKDIEKYCECLKKSDTLKKTVSSITNKIELLDDKKRYKDAYIMGVYVRSFIVKIIFIVSAVAALLTIYMFTMEYILGIPPF